MGRLRHILIQGWRPPAPAGPGVPGCPALHSQARDAGAVVRELLVAGHAVDVDDVDDGVLCTDPHLVPLCHRHAILEGWAEDASSPSLWASPSHSPTQGRPGERCLHALATPLSPDQCTTLFCVRNTSVYRRRVFYTLPPVHSGLLATCAVIGSSAAHLTPDFSGRPLTAFLELGTLGGISALCQGPS